MEKPGIEPATPGLQGIALIHYTTGASQNLLKFEDGMQPKSVFLRLWPHTHRISMLIYRDISKYLVECYISFLFIFLELYISKQ